MTDGRVIFLIPVFNLLFTDSIVGDDLTVYKNSLNVTAGQSVLLPTSYSITYPLKNWPSIEWVTKDDTIVYCSVTNGSLGAEGRPVWVTENTIISPKYQGRVDFFRLNASLFLKDLTEMDTGSYTVRLLMDGNIYKGAIHLWVHQSPAPTDSMVGDNLTVHTSSLNVSVGQSLLLPTTYSISSPAQSWPSIEWAREGQTIVHCSVSNGSIRAKGLPVWVNEKTGISPEYQGRVEFFPLNASLLLKDLSVNDSGTYTVKLLTAKNVIKGTIHVWVQRSPASLGDDLTVHKGFFNITAGQSVLLPATYSVSSSLRYWPSIEWVTGGQTIVHCSVHNGSLGAEGLPLWVTDNTIISPEYQGRVEFFPLNASLLLKDLSVNDSGTYTVRLLMPGNIMGGTISVWVESTPASFGKFSILSLVLLHKLCRNVVLNGVPCIN
ncbi:carcinoembryonic antigen-related cell adhesion molecule 3-like isoform X1 [Xenopus tropicalis]|uniref:Carcinoembryonic antigen-related cell adhesion molecule 3-like isoform X1 n=1 Tax=Xenopus tropicalis TaxID=8364 RepID=A0A8J1ISH8_XENTR|nr:carcinoembryonic antigen-related cell adhesion molecule 3-like isoform X1 [Xenopus tropicalis]